MLIHLDTSLLVDAFTRSRSLAAVRTATDRGDSMWISRMCQG
jgi:hypothetical protein